MSNFRIYNDQLCPALWDSAQHLNPEVRVNLLRMAYDFYEKTKLPAPIIDVYLMGSIANYNWTTDSDCDVHVIVDYTKLQMPPETANKTVKTAGAQWNAEHKISVKGYKVEMNIQNSAEQKPHVTAIYSLVKDQWVRKPSKLFPQIDRSVVDTQYKAMKGYVENSIRSGDQEQMKAAKKYLDAYRQYGLDTYGELSYENIIYKILRSRGIIKQLKDSITTTYDHEMTVKEGDIIGTTYNGVVNGADVQDAYKAIHKDKGMISGINSQNWRYISKKNTVVWNTEPTEDDKHKVTDWLAKKGINNPTHRPMYRFDEVGVKDLKSRHPHPFMPQKLGPDPMGPMVPDFSKMTLDNIKALRDKASRDYQWARDNQDHGAIERALARYREMHKELRRRLDYINQPVNEAPEMSLHGKVAKAGNEPLKNQNVEKVIGNIVVIRQATGGGFIAEGWTLVYFMDSEESAEKMKRGEIPYLVVPVGTFTSGGSPITDIWKKRFQKPGTEHILGVLQGHSDSENIFIDMLTVRPKWQRNHIAKLMVDRLKKTFPDANITTSSRTDKGSKFCKGYGINESHDLDHKCWSDFSERRDRALFEICDAFKKSRGKGRFKWATIQARLLKKVWLQFGLHRRIDENDLDKIADQILTNIARLQASTEIMGHTSHDARPELEDLGYTFTDKEWEAFGTFLVNSEGQWLLSDYGLEPLQKIYAVIYKANTPEEKLYACDKALNVVHQRGDLAALFVEGGTATLNHIAEMGGYNAGGAYGDVNREFRNESCGVGSGIPEDDRLSITNQDGSVRRWQIRSKDAPKTPQMTDTPPKAVKKFDPPIKK